MPGPSSKKTELRVSFSSLEHTEKINTEIQSDRTNFWTKFLTTHISSFRDAPNLKARSELAYQHPLLISNNKLYLISHLGSFDWLIYFNHLGADWTIQFALTNGVIGNSSPTTPGVLASTPINLLSWSNYFITFMFQISVLFKIVSVFIPV